MIGGDCLVFLPLDYERDVFAEELLQWSLEFMPEIGHRSKLAKQYDEVGIKFLDLQV